MTGLPRTAQFQSTRSACPSRTQTLSLRTSKWRNASPASTQAVSASTRRGSAAAEPRLGAEPEREEGSGVALDLRPAGEHLPEVVQRAEPLGHWSRGDLGEGGPHGLDVSRPPGRRPVPAAQILEGENGEAVVLPAEEAGEEASAHGCVDALFVAKPARRELVDSGLEEGGAPVREPDEPAFVVRVASADRARRDGSDPEQSGHRGAQSLVHLASQPSQLE